jgi:hypothetical protein
MDACHLPLRVHARIRTSRPVHRHSPAVNQREHTHKLALHRTLLIALRLPAMKIRPVILKRQLIIHKRAATSDE